MNANHDWKGLARKHYPGAQITGEGKHAVVLRCAGPHFLQVHLFESWQTAYDFAAANCGMSCYHKHTQGNLEVYLPHPRPLRGANLAAYVEAD
jgi:hypothetical protein